MIRIIRTKHLEYYDFLGKHHGLITLRGSTEIVSRNVHAMPSGLPIELMQEWDDIAEQIIFERMIQPTE